MHLKYSTSFTKGLDLPISEESRKEICFLGRSNAGKSSLINSLARQKSLARTSQTPGRTQMVNYFEFINFEETFLVDLPGYGYQKAGKKISESWGLLLDAYLKRPNIQLAVFVFDGRRDFDELDYACFEMLRHIPQICFVATKMDKLNKQDAMKRKTYLLQNLKNSLVHPPSFFSVSNLTQDGIEPLRDHVMDVVQNLSETF